MVCREVDLHRVVVVHTEVDVILEQVEEVGSSSGSWEELVLQC